MTNLDRAPLMGMALLLAVVAVSACGRDKAAIQPVTIAPGADAGWPAEEDAREPDMGQPAGTAAEAVDGSAAEDAAGEGAPADDALAGPADASVGDARADDAPTDDADPGDDLCQRLCAVLLGTGCAPDKAKCQAGCATDLAGSCASQARAFYGCEAALTPAEFSCDTRGRLRLTPGKCDDADSHFVDCLLDGAV